MAEFDTISLTPVESSDLPEISLEAPGGTPTYNADYTDKKAQRYDLLLGQDSPGVDVIRSDIQNGKSDVYDRSVAEKEKIADTNTRLGLVRDIASSRDPLTAPDPREVMMVKNILDDELYQKDPMEALSRNAAQMLVNVSASHPDSRLVEDTLESDPDLVYDSLDRAQYASQRALTAQEIAGETQGKYDQEGFISKGAAWLLDFTPLLNSVQMGIVNSDGALDQALGSVLNGSSIEEKISNLYSLPPEQFRAELKATVDRLYEINPHLAMQFSQAAMNYSDDNSTTDNLMSIVDFAGVVPGAKLVEGASRLLKGKSLEKIARSAGNSPREISKTAGELGMHDTAIRSELLENAAKGDPTGLKGLEDLTNPQVSGPNPKISEKVEQRLPTNMSPGKNYGDVIDLSSTARNRQAEIFERYANDPLVRSVSRIDTLEPEQLEQAIARIDEHKKDLFRSTNHNVIDQIFIPAEEDKIGNVNRMTFVFGRKDGSLFPTEKAAQTWINRYLKKDTNDGIVVPHGTGGYVVNVTKPIGETSIRDLSVVPSVVSPDRTADALLGDGRITSPDYQLSKAQTRARGVVAHSTEYMAELFKAATKDLQGLSKQSNEALNKVWDSGRTQRRYFKTEREFSEEFYRQNNRAPSSKEIQANSKYIELNDLDWFLRNADIRTQMERKGLEKISIPVEGKDTKSLDFTGTVVDRIPWDSKDNFVVRVIEDRKAGKYFLKSNSSAEKVGQMLSDGSWTIVRNDAESTYYLTKEVSRSNLDQIILPYVEGGHIDYQYPHFIKQAKISVNDGNIHRYDGDISFASVPTESMAKEVTRLLEEGRRLILRNDPRAKKFFDDNLSDFITLQDFLAKVKTGAIDINQPFVNVRKGQSALTESTYQSNLPAGHTFLSPQTSSHNSLATVGGRFMGQRDETILPVIMSENNRLVKTDYPSLIRPSDVLSSSIKNIIDLRVTNDLKWKSANDWIQEFGHLVDEDINKLRTNPEAYLSGNIRYRSGTDPRLQGKAERVRRAMSTMLNTPTQGELKFNLMKESLLEKITDSSGMNSVRGKLAEGAISTITHAPSFMKAFAFHSYLGLGNIKQLFVQGAEVYKIGLISPIQGSRASSILGQAFAALKTENPEVLSRLSRMTPSFFGKPQEFLDMVERMKKSGFAIVGHDQQFLDGVSRGIKTTSGVPSKILDYGLSPFKAGELTSRVLAYGTSYLEWKKANPGRVLDRRGEAAILQRAKDLTTNMGRDSAASWQRNPVLSVPAQFLSYHARFMEQLWDGGFGSGKKLTQAEKARVIVGMGVAYGIPATFGGLGLPISKEMVSQQLLEWGYEKDNVLINALVGGLFTEATNVFYGEKLDLSQSYGPSGPWRPLIDMINGDKTLIETIAGAGGGVTGQNAYQLYGAIGEAYNSLLSDEGGWPVAQEALLEPLKNISSVNNTLKLWHALNTQKYLSKNGTIQAENVEAMAAIGSYLMGVPLERVSDAYEKLAVTYRQKDHIESVQKDVQTYYRKATQAANRGDMESMKYYNDQAYSLGIREGLSSSEIRQSFSRALDDESLTDKAAETYERFHLQLKNRKN